MAGLAGVGSIREPAPDDLEDMPVIGLHDGDDDAKTTNILVDAKTGHVTTYNDDGSVEIDTEPNADQQAQDGPIETEFNENLAKHMSLEDRNALGAAIYEGVENDLKTRNDFEEIFSKGIDLLGLKIDAASSQASAEGTVSRVYHPLLLETVVKYQANFIAEMLPASGPVKVRDDQPDDPEQPPPNPNNPMEVIAAQQNKNRDVIAEAFEKDMNHYLTVTATEFYIDTDKMSFVQGFTGNGYKKQFHCPLRKRPVSESIPPQDLIVSNNAVDLENALRVTHRTKVSAAVLKRMQLNKSYLNVPIQTPNVTQNVIEDKIGRTEGVDKTPQLPADYEHTMYETMIDIDLKGFEHRVNKDDEYDPKGEPSGLPLPYIVTIERDSQTVLSVKRNWKETDTEFKKKVMIVHYPLIPGLGFLGYGFVHLLGNTTRALTATTRLLIDAGQFSCFPGFLMAKGGSKQTTNDLRIMPGTGKEIDTMGKPINDVVMKLPYNQPSPALMDLLKQMAEDGMRLGGAAQIPVGEGRADIPVGTMLASIEQSTKVMGAIHKRNHYNFAKELKNIRDLFIEDPKSLWKLATKPARKWEVAEEFADKDLVPASDPNVPSQLHRIMMATGIVQMASSPTGTQIYNQLAVHERALRVLGVADPGSLFNPPPQAGQVSPEQQAQQMEAQLKKQELDIKQAELQQKQTDTQVKVTEQQRKAQEALLDQRARSQEQQLDLQNDQANRDHELQIKKMELVGSHLQERNKGIAANQIERVRHAGGIVASHVQNLHDRIMQHGDQQHEHAIMSREHQHAKETQVGDLLGKDHLQQTKPQPKPDKPKKDATKKSTKKGKKK